MNRLELIQTALFLLSIVIQESVAYGQCADNSMECIPLKQCPRINNLSLKILSHKKGAARQELFSLIRQQMCSDRGAVKQLLVCCQPADSGGPQEEQGGILSRLEKRSGRYLGSFKQMTYHPVRGDLTVRDEQTFTIKNFVYDGEGPDVFFIVGLRNARPRPNPRDAIPVPYPAPAAAPPGLNPEPRIARVPYRYDDPDIPILGRFDGQDIDLRLPNGIGVGDIKWISLYCRQFGIDFGHVNLGGGGGGQSGRRQQRRGRGRFGK